MKKKVHRFEVYRYQILPIDRFFQGELFGEIKNIDDLIQSKNTLFSNVLQEMKRIPEGKNVIIAKLLFSDKDFFLYRFAVNRSITIETEKFTEEEIENWPSFFVAFWNDSIQQYVIVEQRREAFQHTDTVITSLISEINGKLSKWHLRMHIEALFQIEEFWKIIERYQGKILTINFELITPNMANISGMLSDELKEFAKNTNTSTTNITIAADPESALWVAHSDEQLNSLVEYSSKGGGNIAIRAKGVKRQIQTAKTKKTIELDELFVSGNTIEDVARALKEILL